MVGSHIIGYVKPSSLGAEPPLVVSLSNHAGEFESLS